MADTVGTLVVKLETDIENLKQGLADAGVAIGGFKDATDEATGTGGGGLRGFFDAVTDVKKVLFTAEIYEAGKAFLDFAESTGNAIHVEEQFNKIIGYDSTRVLDQLRESTLGNVEDTRLMADAITAHSRGISDNYLPLLGKWSEQLKEAKLGAFSLSEGIDAISRAAETGMTRGLVTMNIDVAKLKEEFKGVTDPGERLILIMQSVSDASNTMAPATKNSADQVHNLASEWEKLTVSLGKAVEPALAGTLEAVNDAISNKGDGMIYTYNYQTLQVKKEINTVDIERKKIEEGTLAVEDLMAAGAQKQADALSKEQSNIDKKNAMLNIANQILHGTSLEQQDYNAKVDELNVKLNTQKITELEYVDGINAANAALDVQLKKISDISAGWLSIGNGDFVSSGSDNGIYTPAAGGGKVQTGGAGIVLHDGIITPQGQVVTTDPMDYIIATKTPGDFAGGGKGGVVVNIYGPIQGLNPNAVAAAIQGNITNIINR